MTWMSVVLVGSAHAGQPFWDEPLTTAQVEAVFDVSPTDWITQEKAKTAFQAMYAANGVGPHATYGDAEECVVGLAERSSNRWGLTLNEERFIYCRDDDSCEAVESYAGASSDTTLVGQGDTARRYFDSAGYVCLLDILFGDGTAVDGCTATWGDLVKHMYLQQNNVVAQRDADMTSETWNGAVCSNTYLGINDNPLGTQWKGRVTLDWESWANEALFRWVSQQWVTRHPNGARPYLDDEMPARTFKDLSGCRDHLPTSVYDKVYGATLGMRSGRFPNGLPSSVADTVASQIAGPDRSTGVQPLCDGGDGVPTPVSVLRSTYGLRAAVAGQLPCRCGACEPGTPYYDDTHPYFYDPDPPVASRLGIALTQGQPQEFDEWRLTCGELEAVVLDVAAEPEYGWTVSGGVWTPTAPDQFTANRRPTYGEVLAFLLAAGNALPNLVDAPFSDLLPGGQLETLLQDPALTSNKEMDFQEAAMDTLMGL